MIIVWLPGIFIDWALLMWFPGITFRSVKDPGITLRFGRLLLNGKYRMLYYPLDFFECSRDATLDS